jgi:hypothetical protein
MADIRKVKLPNGTTYNIKDNTARSNINNIVNGTTKLPYGKSLSITNDTELNLLDPNSNILSTVNLPGGGVSYYEGTWSHYNDDWTNFAVYDNINITGGTSGIKNGDIVVIKGNDELKIGLAGNNGFANFSIYQHSNCYISTLYDTVLICVGRDEYNKPVFCIVNNIPADDIYREYADNAITAEEKIGFLLNQMKYAYRIDDNADTYDIGYILLDSNNSEVSANRRFYLVNDVKAMACYSFNSPNSTVTHIKNESTPVNSKIVPKGISTSTFMASNPGNFATYMCPLAYKFNSSPSANDKGYYPMYDDSDYMQNMCNIVVTFDKIMTY